MNGKNETTCLVTVSVNKDGIVSNKEVVFPQDKDGVNSMVDIGTAKQINENEILVTRINYASVDNHILSFKLNGAK